MTLQEKINEAAKNYAEKNHVNYPGGPSYIDTIAKQVIADNFESGANFMLPMLEAEQARLKIAVEALKLINEIEGKPGGRHRHDPEPEDLAREALAEIDRVGG